MKIEQLILVGGGAFARELINWAHDAAEAGIGQKVTAFLDDTPTVMDAYSYDVKHLGGIHSYTPQPGDAFLMAIADPMAKRLIATQLKAKGAVFAGLRHPSAIVSRSATLGEGVILCPQSVVSADAHVGDLVTINIVSGPGHDVRVGAYSTLSSHVDLMGRVEVGECVFFGSGAKVLPGVKIGDGARIGVNATIMRSVPAGAVMYSQPAKRL